MVLQMNADVMMWAQRVRGGQRQTHKRTCSAQLTCIIHTPPHWLSMRASVKSCSRKGVIQHFSQSVARLAATRVTAVTATVTDVNLTRDKIGTCSMKPATPQESENTEERLSRCFITPIHQKEQKTSYSHSLDLTECFGLRPDNSATECVLWTYCIF